MQKQIFDNNINVLSNIEQLVKMSCQIVLDSEFRANLVYTKFDTKSWDLLESFDQYPGDWWEKLSNCKFYWILPTILAENGG